MFRVDFLCDIIDICVGFKATDMSDVYFDDGVIRDYFDFFKFARDNNKKPYVYDYYRDGRDLVIVVRYEF